MLADLCSELLSHQVGTAKLCVRHLKHFGQVVPYPHIALDKDRSSFAAVFRAVFVDSLLCFWAQTQVREYDIAVARQQKASK